MAFKLEDFFTIKQTPIPDGLKTLMVRNDRRGPGWRFTHQDLGFEERPGFYVGLAETGDEDSQLLIERAKVLFKELMERDKQKQNKLNELTGDPELDENGEPVPEMRSQWREAEGVHGQILPGNPRLPEDFWFQYVEKNWNKILPELLWFDPEPSTDPEDPHTERLVARMLHPNNPQRKAALDFLKEHNVEAAESGEKKAEKQPA